MKKLLKTIVCVAPGVLTAAFVSPLLIGHGSSAAFDMAIGLPLLVLFIGVGVLVNWN